MISLCEDCEYTVLIANLIETLSSVERFSLKIWVSNVELPFKFNESDDIQFLQEGVRIERDGKIEYIFYDLITHIKVVYL